MSKKDKFFRILRISGVVVLAILFLDSLADIIANSNASSFSFGIVYLFSFFIALYFICFYPNSDRKVSAEFLLQIKSAIKAFRISSSLPFFSDYELYSFAEALFKKQQKSEYSTLSYKTDAGLYYSASSSDPMQFALISMSLYAEKYGYDDLRAFCEEHLADARRTDINRF